MEADQLVVARWREGETLKCDTELAVVARAMVAARMSVSPDGISADLAGPPELAALTLIGALDEVIEASIEIDLRTT